VKILILEDDHERHALFRQNLKGHDVHIVEEADACIDLLRDEAWDCLFLDHDLGGTVMAASGPGTGYQVAVWLHNEPDRIPKIVIIHSFNPGGAQMMHRCIPGSVLKPAIWTEATLGEQLRDIEEQGGEES
jgi:CheY-like chemotaxis protein